MTTGGTEPGGDVVFDRYRLDKRVAVGGMGVLWRATDTVLDGVVALKRVSLAHLDEDDARVTRERALREARLAARLRDHPNIVSLYDVRVSEGDVWLVMEYLPSRSLRDVVRGSGTLTPPQVARIGADLAAALDAAHRLDIRHRDVTPGNVLIGDEGRVKLTDFGIALAATDDRLTQTGAIIGTLPYLAPEIAREEVPSAASDVFSLGATLYFALEGRSPYEHDDNPIRMLRVVAEGVVRPARNAGPLSSLLSSMLATDAADRPSAAEVRTALNRAAAGQEAIEALIDAQTGPTPKDVRKLSGVRRQRIVTGVVAAAVILLVIALVALNRPDDTTQTAGPVPTLPSGDVRMPRQARSVDTCGLLSSVVAQLFDVRTVRRGGILSSCSADVYLSGGAHVKVGYNASPAQNDSNPQPDKTHQRGVNEYLAPPTREGSQILQCTGQVLLADHSGFYGLVSAVNKAAFSVDLCDVMSQMDSAAARIMVEKGVPNSRWADDYRLADAKACDVLGNNAEKIFPELHDKLRLPKFADWTCHTGLRPNERALPTVLVTFNLMIEDDFVRDPEINQVPVDGIVSYQEPDPNHGCRVYMPTRYGRDSAGLSQFLTVLVRADESQDRRCDAARRLAGAAYRALPH